MNVPGSGLSSLTESFGSPTMPILPPLRSHLVFNYRKCVYSFYAKTLNEALRVGAWPEASQMRSIPLPLVNSITLLPRSTSRTLIVSLAPIFFASVSLSSNRSAAMTRFAPSARALATQNKPTGPAPMTRISLPATSIRSIILCATPRISSNELRFTKRTS